MRANKYFKVYYVNKKLLLAYYDTVSNNKQKLIKITDLSGNYPYKYDLTKDLNVVASTYLLEQLNESTYLGTFKTIKEIVKNYPELV